MNETRFDVVVVSAGTAGVAAAWQFAKCGRTVALVDARAFADSGARWVNAARQLAEAATAHPDIGSVQALWDYQARFMRSHGAIGIRRLVVTHRPLQRRRR